MPRRIEPDPSATKVGERLRELRLERNMSLAELADAAEISKGHLSSVEHGLAAITVQTISRLAKGLSVNSLYLLTFPPDDERDEIAELVRKLPASEVTKLRRELTKLAKATAKETPKVAAKATAKVTTKVTAKVTAKVTPKATAKVTTKATPKATAKVTAKATKATKATKSPAARSRV